MDHHAVQGKSTLGYSWFPPFDLRFFDREPAPFLRDFPSQPQRLSLCSWCFKDLCRHDKPSPSFSRRVKPQIGGFLEGGREKLGVGGGIPDAFDNVLKWAEPDID